MSRIAVLLTCFNRRSITLRCLRSLSEQVLRGQQVDVYLVDDGSTDGTGDAVRREFPQVRAIQGTGNLYWGGGMRLADAVAWGSRPDYLLWLNDDVKLRPDAIATLLATARAASDRAVVVGGLGDVTGSVVTYGGYRQPDPRRPLALEMVEPADVAQPVATMNGNLVLIPACVREEVGPPDHHFSHNMADMDFGFRAREAGFEVLLAPGILGTCERNMWKATWRDPEVPFPQRMRAVMGFSGHPPLEWFEFVRRYGRPRRLRYFVGPYLRAMFAPWLMRYERRFPSSHQRTDRVRG